MLGETYTKVFSRLGPAAYATLSEQGLLDNAKLLVIKRRNMYVHRYKLTSMKQSHDEPIIGFESRLQPAARTGKFKKKVKCNVLNWASVVDLASAPNLGPTPDGDLQEGEEVEMTWKDARIHMMSALRLAAEPKNTKPDPDFDVSEAVLASMELGVKSIT